jgi:hypothetical protein
LWVKTMGFSCAWARMPAWSERKWLTGMVGRTRFIRTPHGQKWYEFAHSIRSVLLVVNDGLNNEKTR